MVAQAHRGKPAAEHEMGAEEGDSGTRRRRASTGRTNFADVAAHELRSPLAVLKGQLQMLQRRLRRQEDREEDRAEVHKMLYQVERLNHQLDVLLDASHIAQRRYQLRPAANDLVAITRRLVEIYKMGTQGHSFLFEAGQEALVGNWDRRRLEEIVLAFLANAVKFSPGGEVVARVERRGDRARIEVMDQGRGVPAAERRRIFRAYYVASNASDGGAGLGLYVAREAAKRQGGTIGVRARPGGGSVFWCELALAPTYDPGDVAPEPTLAG